jgi:SAM-dependent methyltransferase
MNPKDERPSPSSGVAAEVQGFYERYPYPRPIDDLDDYRRLWRDEQRRRADHHLNWASRPFREERSILVAGCGTSQAAKHALRWPSARVTGIDFSATSVRCTENLKRKYKLDNLQVRQLPIERALELETEFDQVVCTGVLHHLADPDAGLAALRAVLEPGGAMQLMVYAPYGRTGIYLLQEFCRRVSISATDEGIADLLTALRSLPPGHPLERLLREAPDFRQAAALADALLHPQDRAYSVPQLFDFLGRGGLTFGRWVNQAPYSARCGVLAGLPQASRLAQLPLPEQYAAVELFRGTMVQHSVVAYRDDGPRSGGEQHLDFAGEEWTGYVPIRTPNTISVDDRKRLPPGAASVLINRGHTYTDLILPIDALEKRFLGAIDGRRTIGEIARLVGGSDAPDTRKTAGGLFERLWWYDQIVFDTSSDPGDDIETGPPRE